MKRFGKFNDVLKKNVYHSVFVAGQKLNNGFRFRVPKENVATIRSGNDKFTFGSVEIDTFHRCVISMTLRKRIRLKFIVWGTKKL